MTNLKETFTERADCQRVLSDILGKGDARAGTTLVAHVDRVTLQVLGVRQLRTPDPVMDADSYFGEGPIHQLSTALRGLAQELVPAPTWDGRRWSAPTGELVTVVCREGEPRITPVETQFFLGWRYSNHLTAALQGDIYVVTPTGWTDVLGEWSGPLPALVCVDAAFAGAPPVAEAERILSEASSTLLRPRRGECLLCYVYRMFSQFDCDGTLRFARHYRDERAPLATGLERRLGQVGGYCDCEIFLNGYDLQDEYWVPEQPPGEVVWHPDDEDLELTWPDPMVACAGVRAGSAQPCALWWRRIRW